MATHSSVPWRIPGMGSLVGCRLRGRTELDTTEVSDSESDWSNAAAAGNLRIGMDLKLSRLKHEATAMEAPGSGHQQKALKQNTDS